MLLQFLLFLLLPLKPSPARATTSTPNTGDQIQAFFFSFTTSPIVLPVTYTCPTPLTLTQLTTTNAQTSDPAAPYTMVMLVHEQLIDGAGIQYERIYSASLNVGSLSQTQYISHPWGNGTQFIACIWASNGVSGGCQDIYTVVPSPDLTAIAYENTSSTCREPSVLGSWVPSTEQTLDVEVTGTAGDVSWNAWPGACTDLKFTPKNGTAPYTLVIAPAAHPPVNITSTSSDSDNSMNYTIRLTHGQAFMAAMYDSAGNSWAFGPLHSGASDDVSCLAVATGQEEKKTTGNGKFGMGEFVGGIAGAFVVGALGAAVLAWLLGRKRKTEKDRKLSIDNFYTDPRPASYRTSSGSIYGYGKPLVESPQIDFDTPATLYDPLVPGPHSSYPQRTPPSSARDRVFPRPPLAHEGSNGEDSPRKPGSSGLYDPFNASHSPGQEEYRDDIALADFHPHSSPGRPRSITSGHSRDRKSDGLPRQSLGQGQGQGHHRDTSYSSLRSDNYSPNRESSGNSMKNSANSRLSLPGALIPPGIAPSGDKDREGSFHSPERTNSPSSPTTGSGGRPRNVYVVHSDGGGGDVHIQLPPGRGNANVIELPPDYQHDPTPIPSPRLIPQSDRTSSPLPSSGSGPGGQSFQNQRLNLPFIQFEPTKSRSSGISIPDSYVNSNDDELRARAEAAMREKDRLLGLGISRGRIP